MGKLTRIGTLGLAAIASAFAVAPKTPTTTAPSTVAGATGETVKRGESPAQAPTASQVVGNKSIGIIDANPPHWYRIQSPIWTGRPRQRNVDKHSTFTPAHMYVGALEKQHARFMKMARTRGLA